MEWQDITDDLILEMLQSPKRVTDGLSLPKDTKQNFSQFCKLEDADQRLFRVVVRQNLLKRSDFSCMLILTSPVTKELHLARYNGNTHPHTNKLERDRFQNQFHKHQTTERYIKRGFRPDGFALPTDDYNDLHGALRQLFKDCNISSDANDWDLSRQMRLT